MKSDFEPEDDSDCPYTGGGHVSNRSQFEYCFYLKF